MAKFEGNEGHYFQNFTVFILYLSILFYLQELKWHSSECTCLKPMWLRFKSWRQRLMWVSGRKNVMSMVELARFEKMAGRFKYFYILYYFPPLTPHSKMGINDINFLALYWKCTCVGPIFFKMHSQNVFI